MGIKAERQNEKTKGSKTKIGQDDGYFVCPIPLWVKDEPDIVRSSLLLNVRKLKLPVPLLLLYFLCFIDVIWDSSHQVAVCHLCQMQVRAFLGYF